LHLSKDQDIELKSGDRVRVRTPGGGGYGDPFQRHPSSVLEDVRLGYYSVEQACNLFGVIINLKVSVFEVDQKATKKSRGV
jgi:N-methylhydantoinase B